MSRGLCIGLAVAPAIGSAAPVNTALDPSTSPVADSTNAVRIDAEPGPPLPTSLEDASDTVVATIGAIAQDFLGHLPLIVAGLIVLVVTAIVAAIASRVVARLLRDVSLRGSLKELIGRFVVITVWATGLLIAAMVTFPGLTPSRALAALGIGSIAIGLAFKDIFENFFAGVLILWRFPFENGDFISCNGIMGRVVNVTVRNTVLRTVNGELVVIPNAELYKNPVDILTNRPRRRVDLMCGVAYGEDVADARRVITEAVSRCPTVSEADEIQVFAHGFGSSSIDFEVCWWTGSTPLEQRRSKNEVVEAIKSGLDEAGIEIPFPYRTLTFKGPVPVDARSDENDPASAAT